MENKIIKATELGPEIDLNNSGKIKISGKSRMEDAVNYFKPLHDWIELYLTEIKLPITVELDLTYFNSSSAKQLLKMLMIIDNSGLDAKVIWHYPSNNDTLLERGNELEVMVDLPFEYIAK